MAREHSVSRRTALKLAGVAGATTFIAGCSGGNGNGDNGGDAGIEIEPDTTILFEGNMGGWDGVDPAQIEGETNPTLVLEDGADYEIGWTQGDGDHHNIQIWDANEEIVDGLETDLTDDPGDGDYLEFTASEEMAYYRCDPHPAMQGEIRVE